MPLRGNFGPKETRSSRSAENVFLQGEAVDPDEVRYVIDRTADGGVMVEMANGRNLTLKKEDLDTVGGLREKIKELAPQLEI
jgi:hypothetical protein